MAWRIDILIDGAWAVKESSISDYLIAVGKLRRYKLGNPVTNAVDGERREFPVVNEDPANDRVRLVEI